MKLSIYKTDGTNNSAKVDLNDEIFKVDVKRNLIYEDVRRYLAGKRQGTASTKERGEVRGGGRKAYRQKGTGMARRGTIRSPLLKGGGTVFGPKPRDYGFKMTKKMRQLARKSALTLKAQSDAIKIVENLTFDEPKTRSMVNLLSAFDLADKKVLILTAEIDYNLYKSARNLKKVQVIEAANATTYQVLNADVLLIQDNAVPVLENSVHSKVEEEAR